MKKDYSKKEFNLVFEEITNNDGVTTNIVETIQNEMEQVVQDYYDVIEICGGKHWVKHSLRDGAKREIKSIQDKYFFDQQLPKNYQQEVTDMAMNIASTLDRNPYTGE